MSNSNDSGFGKFVPGFEFLQNLASSAVKGAATNIPQLPNLANWVAPTLNVEELEKRLQELKAVHFWLDQNSRALGATIQALEVQKMTLSTLKGMNFNLGDVANALKIKTADALQSGMERVTPKPPTKPATKSKPKASAAKPVPTTSGLVDPIQLWGALTQQFQEIAAGAMKETAKNTAVDFTKNMASGLTREAVKSARDATKNATNFIAKNSIPELVKTSKTLKNKSAKGR